ncbi:beta-lactamase family protein [Bacillus sp. YC2]|uniref:serine hydrolase domain-containing protein n=1 Tax=Bacillus sp. YC2 TaxID=2861287 RepID=UPI001CA68169|nr:serine hydrolase domain-containing protein [Bacillus sp. YC2]MBY8914136.1 beta-lactamase family protein [Bacillus sp. YC2]
MKCGRIVSVIICLFFIYGGKMEAQALDVGGLDSKIEKQAAESGIPGIEVVAVKGGRTIYSKGFGFADRENKRPVTDSALFEIGSTSKAFTAFGVLQLAESGKIDLQDPVSRYIKGFYAFYQGKKREITVEQLLHHTSGIPFLSIAGIASGKGKDALKETAESLIGFELAHKPGTVYEYATINYDVLGYIIEKVTGQSYEQYITRHVLKNLGLTGSYAGRQAAEGHADLSRGYKMGFFKARPYEAPVYRGNTPAGYIMTNGKDLAKWLKIQLNQKGGEQTARLIDISHQPNEKIKTDVPDTRYAYGWSVIEKEGRPKEIFHAGSNPNYSSFFIISPDTETAVGVLANMNSAYPEHMARTVLQFISGQKNPETVTDPFQVIDRLSAVLSVSLSAVILFMLYRFGKWRRKVKAGENTAFQWKKTKAMLWLLLLVFGLVLPEIIAITVFNGLPWKMVFIWGPSSLIYLAAVYYLLIVLVCGFGLAKCLYRTFTPRSETYDV